MTGFFDGNGAAEAVRPTDRGTDDRGTGKKPVLDRPAFRALYEKRAGRLVNWLCAMGADYGTACDVVQETFLRLWAHRKDFADGEPPVAWLYSVARRLSVDQWRGGRRLVSLEGSREDGKPSVEPAADGELDEVLARERLVRAFDRLPPELREAYVLFQVAGESVHDTAAVTGVSEDLVKVRVHRARKKLQKILADL